MKEGSLFSTEQKFVSPIEEAVVAVMTRRNCVFVLSVTLITGRRVDHH